MTMAIAIALVYKFQMDLRWAMPLTNGGDSFLVLSDNYLDGELPGMHSITGCISDFSNEKDLGKWCGPLQVLPRENSPFDFTCL